MPIRFVGIDPDTAGNNCPAVFVDETTGDLLFQGPTVTEPRTLAQVERHSPIADTESVVRLPARMKAIIMEAINDARPHVEQGVGPTDQGGHLIGGASGDAR